MRRRPPTSPLFPYATLFRSAIRGGLSAGYRLSERLALGATYSLMRSLPYPAATVEDGFTSKKLDENGSPVAHIGVVPRDISRSEEHTSELQSRQYLVCRLLL